MTLFLSLIFGAVGTVYFVYGRRQHSVSYLICGFVLIVYPYVFESAAAIIGVGVVVAMIPPAIDKGWI